ncbi:Hint domain-containing protein [Acetobacter indonesiensis]
MSIVYPSNGTPYLTPGTTTFTSGQVVSGVTVTSNSQEILSSGATGIQQTIEEASGNTEGGEILVLSGAQLLQGNDTANWLNSGKIIVYDGGFISGGAATSGGITTILSGGIAEGIIAGNAGSIGTVIFSSGAILKGKTVARSGGTISGGTATSGAQIKVLSGGVLTHADAGNGGTITVSSGGKSTSTVISSGGTITVSAGGVAASTILSGGDLTVYGSAVDTTVNSGSTESVLSGGVASHQTVQSGGQVVVGNSGTLIQTSVNSLGQSGNWQNSGSIVVSSGGLVSGGVADGGGVTTILSGGVASGTVAGNSGTIVVSAGGNTNSAVISSGGTITVSAGGVAASTILSGGDLTVYGSAVDTTVNSGSTESVLSGGVASHQTVQSGGQVVVGNSGTLIQTGVNSLGQSGNWQNSGSIVVSSGGLVSGGVADGGGVTTILSGGVASGTVAGNSGTIVVSAGGNTNSAVISSGGTLTFTGGGSGSYTSLLAGGTLNIGSGTTYDNQHTTSLTATSGAQINVLSGGVLTNADAAAFGNIVVSKGGMGQDIIISSGGGLWVAGIASDTSVNNGGGIAIASGGVSNNNNVNSGGKIYADSGSVLGLTSVSSGGSAIVASGATISDVVTIQDGGTATIWNNTSGTIDLSGDTNHGLTISGLESGGTVSTVISGWSGSAPGNSDSIDLPGVSADGASYAYPSDDQVVVTLANGNTITLNIPGVKNTGFVLSDDGHGGASAEVCFLSGSMIDTPNGDVPVENIRMGDTVIAYVHGVSQETTVTWAGTARAAVRSHLRDDEAGYPVRILKDAVSDGVPYKDMLITPEHCLFFDGRFIPARMLINGSSIFYDKSITTYDYYHIETEHHAVIKADGMLTESYLDTGNRRAFIQEGNLVSLRNTNQNWENDAAVPLCVERSFVEPVFRTLQARSVKLFGEQDSVTTAQLTHNPDLHLVTENGASVRPVRQEENVYSFMLPPGTTSVRIVSRTARPSDIIGPFVDDRRELGVAIGTISLVTANKKQSVLTHLASEKPDGWYPENGERSIAWTNGNAFLPLEERAFPHQILLLSLTVLAAGPYLFEENTHTNPDMKKQSA